MIIPITVNLLRTLWVIKFSHGLKLENLCIQRKDFFQVTWIMCLTIKTYLRPCQISMKEHFCENITWLELKRGSWEKVSFKISKISWDKWCQINDVVTLFLYLRTACSLIEAQLNRPLYLRNNYFRLSLRFYLCYLREK